MKDRRPLQQRIATIRNTGKRIHESLSRPRILHERLREIRRIDCDAAYNSRVMELVAEMKQANPSASERSVWTIARERASFERFARQRVQLPSEGLRDIIRGLTAEGFYIEPDYYSTLSNVYFPDGWKITPSERTLGSMTGASRGYLIDPSGTPRFSIFFKSGGEGQTAQITPLRRPR